MIDRDCGTSLVIIFGIHLVIICFFTLEDVSLSDFCYILSSTFVGGISSGKFVPGTKQVWNDF